MFVISKDFSFSASHRLSHLSEDHKCHRLHGHNYRVRIYLAAPYLDQRGFVKDYGELKEVKEYLDQRLDHRHLNDVFGNSIQTTAEKLAEFLFYEFRHALLITELVAVGVSETDNTWAWFSQDDKFLFGF